MPSNSVSVFDSLLGKWTFVRAIPGYATATGHARITPESEESARYEEVAQLTLLQAGSLQGNSSQGGSIRGTQCYRYQRLPPPANGFQVFFCDTGELFQRLEFHAGEGGHLIAQAHFLCIADEYTSEYTLDPQQRLHVRHTVRGPRKHYEVETHYERAG